MKNSLIHPKLAHLTAEEIQILVQEYYANVKVDTLINRFNISCTRGQFFKLLPQRLSGQTCPECATEMVFPRPSRNASLFVFERQLHCPRCLKKPEILYNKRKLSPPPAKQLSDGASSKSLQNKHLTSNDLSLEQAIALQAAVAYSESNRRMTTGRRVSGSRFLLLAPTPEYGKQLTLSLEDIGLLSPIEKGDDRSSSSSRVSNKIVVFGSKYKITEVVTQELIEDVQSRLLKSEWPDHWYEEICLVIFDLAFAEIKEFYEFCIQERGFPYLYEKRVTNLILNLLEDFSVAQCFHIIFRGAQSATDFLVRSNASPPYAVNYMLSTCQRYADRARESNKVLVPFERNRNCPRSLMSTILYKDVLKINDDGITTPILEVAP
ncbi:hypothetical protein ACVFVO_14600 [Advenella kashmirensis]